MHYEPVGGPVSYGQTASHHGKSDWLPHGLRRAFLVSLIVLVGSLEVALAVIHSISKRNSGLGDDTGEVRTTAARVAPTVLAVILCFIVSVVFQDVKRTEPFARLASKDGATADQSLTWLPGAWWKVLYSSLRFGSISTGWPLFCTTVVYVLGILIVSPFSSTLIVPSDVVFVQEQPFSKLDLDSLMPLRASPQSTTYFRTISHVLYNATTSAWVTNDHVILPFWPAENTVALGPVLSTASQQWKANTTVFSSALDCEPLIQRPIEWLKENDTRAIFEDNLYNLSFESESGCTFTVPGESQYSYEYGGMTWAHASNLIMKDFMWAPHYQKGDDMPGEWAVNATNCGRDEIVVFTEERQLDTSGNKSSKASTGFHCTAQFFRGDVLATAQLGTGSSKVEIDEEEYMRVRTPMSSSEFDSSSFEEVFLNSNWTTYIHPSTETYPYFAFGPANLLAAPYNYSGSALAAKSPTDQLADMSNIKGRFLAEVFRDIFDSSANLEPLSSVGMITETRRRMLIVPSIAILLEITLGLQLVLLISIMIHTRLSRRPLEIRADPAPALNLAKLVANESNSLQALKRTADSQSEVKSNLAGMRFKIENSHIYQTNAETNPGDIKLNEGIIRTDTTATKAEAQPGFHYSTLLGCSLFITAVLVGIGVLYSWATTTGLYQKVFVYNVEVSVAGVDIHGFNPALILTTFVAVCIGLWWGLIETTYRKVQPFLSMAKETTYLDKGPAISYESSYLIWGAFRAIKRNHWILATVCTGTFLSQILTISMASLWSQNPGLLKTNMTIERPLQLRTVPKYYHVDLPQQGFMEDYRAQALESLLGQVQASWVYGGAVQASLNGSDPKWGSDGWSFVPAPIPSLPEVTEVVGGNTVTDALFNLTVNTRGVRARLDCSPYQNFDPQETKAWLTEWNNVQRQGNWSFNATLPGTVEVGSGYQLGAESDVKDVYAVPPLTLGEQYDVASDTTYDVQTQFFATDRMLTCCENATDEGAGMASIGYWSWNDMKDASVTSPYLQSYTTFPKYGGEWPANFTVKWIRGRPLENYYRNMSSTELTQTLLWADKPEIMVLNCKPVIETDDAKVTVDQTGQVVDYVLQDKPSTAPEAWEDQFRLYQNEAADQYERNATVSYGVQFLMALLGAANPSVFSGAESFGGGINEESVTDQSFTIKQSGLNVDYMSYSMLGAIGNDADALLDPESLAQAASKVFTTFFQNFATFNTTMEDGGYVFQRVGEKLPADIGIEDTDYDLKRRQSGQGESENSQHIIISRSADRLEINLPAAWLSLLILAYLLVICVVSAVASLRYSKLLLRRIESIADVASLMAGSPKLLDLARHRSEGELKYKVRAKARLGWFRDETGGQRWGIELVEPEGASEKNDEAGKDMLAGQDSKGQSQINVSETRATERDSEGISLMSS